MTRFVALSTLSACLALTGPVSAQTSSNGRHLYETGSDLFNRGSLSAAVDAFEKFLQKEPQSPRAAEAVYKLACAHVLADQEPEARQAFERLVREYPNSSWAALAIRTQLSDRQTADLADKLYREGCANGAVQDLETASALCKAYLARFLDRDEAIKKSREEIVYKIAYCQRRRGQTAEFEQAMHALAERDADGNWGRLAALWLADASSFAGRMDAFMHHGNCGHEQYDQYQAFLDRSDEFLFDGATKSTDNQSAPLKDKAADSFDLFKLPKRTAGSPVADTHSISTEDRVKCLYYRARCFEHLDRMDEALAGYRAVLHDYADSQWAPECALWLAEDHFRRQEFAEARAAYRELAEKYPDSPRAAPARDWARWIDEIDSNGRHTEKTLAVLYDRLKTLKGNVAFTLTNRTADGTVNLRIRCALQDREHYLLSVTFGTTDFLIACNDDGMWYRAPDRNALTHARKRVPLPAVHLVVKQDEDGLHCFSETADDADGKLLVLPSTLLGCLAERIKGNGHVHQGPHRDASGRRQTVFVLRNPPEMPDEPCSTTELELDRHHMLRAVRLLMEDNGKRSTLALSDLVLGEPLSATALQVPVPEGLDVRLVEEISPGDIWADAFRLFAAILDSLKTDYRQ